MITVGLDIGSTAAKGVLVNCSNKCRTKIYYEIMPTGWSPRTTGEELLKRILASSHCSSKDIDKIAATGYGRETIPFTHKTITEITCHARGASYLAAGSSMVIDVGGQDSKIIKIDEKGRVLDFIMNDKCAAGTGRFLEVTSAALGLDVSDLGNFADFKNFAPINSMCTVFAETEVIGLLAKGVPKESIVAGLLNSVCTRIAGMACKFSRPSKVAFTGGVALNKGIQKALQQKLDTQIVIPQYAQFAGALGAALIISELRV
ncbi:MAG: acyl-CoA dehydratase activase [Bacillota bacterium]